MIFDITSIPEYFATVVSVSFNTLRYAVDWVIYCLASILDIFWSMIATIINCVISMASFIFDLIATVFVWTGSSSGPVFVYFVATLVFLTLMFFVFRVIIALKNLILRWV